MKYSPAPCAWWRRWVEERQKFTKTRLFSIDDLCLHPVDRISYAEHFSQRPMSPEISFLDVSPPQHLNYFSKKDDFEHSATAASTINSENTVRQNNLTFITEEGEDENFVKKMDVDMDEDIEYSSSSSETAEVSSSPQTPRTISYSSADMNRSSSSQLEQRYRPDFCGGFWDDFFARKEGGELLSSSKTFTHEYNSFKTIDNNTLHRACSPIFQKNFNRREHEDDLCMSDCTLPNHTQNNSILSASSNFLGFECYIRPLNPSCIKPIMDFSKKSLHRDDINDDSQIHVGIFMKNRNICLKALKDLHVRFSLQIKNREKTTVDIVKRYKVDIVPIHSSLNEDYRRKNDPDDYTMVGVAYFNLIYRLRSLLTRSCKDYIISTNSGLTFKHTFAIVADLIFKSQRQAPLSSWSFELFSILPTSSSSSLKQESFWINSFSCYANEIFESWLDSQQQKKLSETFIRPELVELSAVRKFAQYLMCRFTPKSFPLIFFNDEDFLHWCYESALIKVRWISQQEDKNNCNRNENEKNSVLISSHDACNLIQNKLVSKALFFRIIFKIAHLIYFSSQINLEYKILNTLLGNQYVCLGTPSFLSALDEGTRCALSLSPCDPEILQLPATHNSSAYTLSARAVPTNNIYHHNSQEHILSKSRNNIYRQCVSIRVEDMPSLTLKDISTLFLEYDSPSNVARTHSKGVLDLYHSLIGNISVEDIRDEAMGKLFKDLNISFLVGVDSSTGVLKKTDVRELYI